MSDEQILINCAKLSSNAVTTPRSSGQLNQTPDEQSLIESAALSNSEKDRNLNTHDHRGNIPKIIINKSDDWGEDEDVFEDEDDTIIERSDLRSAKSLSSPKTEDGRRIQLTEDVLITYANLSDNELRTMTQDSITETFDGRDKKQVHVPRLDICNVSDDYAYDSDNDGYMDKNPVDSDDDADRDSGQAVGVIKRRIVINENASPRKSKYAIDDTTHIDGEFNALVIDTANAMNAIEFEDIMIMFQDTVGFEAFSNLDSPIKLLSRLARHKAISVDNLHHLQAMVCRLANPLLQLKARQYVKHRGQTVFFHPPIADVLEDFDIFKCHVSGKDFTRLNRNDLETIRSTVSQLLFIPPNCVYIVGIQPGINLVISLMVPQRYIGTLMKMATEGLPELRNIGVDLIHISDRTIKTQGMLPTVASGNDHMKFLTVYQQVRDNNLELEERDREIAELKEEIEFIKLELETKNAEIEVLGGKPSLHSQRRQERVRQPVRRRRSLPTMTRDSVTKMAVSFARQPVKPDGKVSEPNEERMEERTRTERTTKNGVQVNKNSKTYTRMGDNVRIEDGSRRKFRQKGSHVTADARGFQWTREDISVLTSVRHVIERGELMDEIETILSELGV